MDTALVFLVNRGTANPFFDVLMPVLTHRGYLLFVPFLIYMFIRSLQVREADGRSHLSEAAWTVAIAVIAVIAVDFLEAVLKPLIGRVRPCNALEGVRLLTACPHGPSMPSGHALSSFAFAVPLLLVPSRWLSLAVRLYPLALASAIAFSRIYLGVHYPTDILAGALIGSGVSILFSLPVILKRSRRRSPC